MYKLFFSFTLMMIAAATSVAQKVEITLTAPSTVNAGQPFRVEVSTNNQDVRLGSPTFEGMQVMGKMQSSNMSFINGVSSVSVSYIYTVMADKPGKYTIPAVKGSLAGTIYNSNSVTIEVVDDGSGSASAGNNNGGNGNNGGTPSSNENVFIDLTVNKLEAYVGEQIIMTASLYSR